jgi:hypothetical protein
MLVFADEIPDISVELAILEAINFCKVSPPSLLVRLTMINYSDGDNSPLAIERVFIFYTSFHSFLVIEV